VSRLEQLRHWLRKAFRFAPLAFAALAALAIGCAPAMGAKPPPTLTEAAAGVEFVAQGVHLADAVCADIAAGLRRSGDPVTAEKLSGDCASAVRDVSDLLSATADAIDAGKAASVRDVACTIIKGARAIDTVRTLVERHGGKLGAEADHVAAFVRPFVDVYAETCQ
jgi:hypothetical protein